MKKLMVLLAAVAMVGAAQAAWFSWKVYSASDSTKNYFKGTVAIMAYAEGESANTAVKVDTLTVTQANKNFSGAFEWTGVKDDTDYYFYGVLTDTNDMMFDMSKSSAVSIVMLSASVIKSSTSTSPADIQLYFNDSVNSASWTAAPEPTSGLLLLVGGALLALRRRRA